MNYELKNKISATTEFLSELANKSWQEIEALRTQIANLADSNVDNKLRKLFKNLLTSYYVFTGELETLMSDSSNTNEVQCNGAKTSDTDNNIEEPLVLTEPINEPATNIGEHEVYEPFEYFIDFDEPIGEPLTDDDLYS